MKSQLWFSWSAKMIAMLKATENVLTFSQPNGQDSTSNSSFKYKEIQPKKYKIALMFISLSCIFVSKLFWILPEVFERTC